MNNNGPSISTNFIDNFHDAIYLPYNYILQCSGKKFRSKLTTAVNNWLNVPEDKMKIICEITETLHNASLIIDDVEDSSQLRRGIPTAHRVFGIPLTINASNYAIFIALQTIGRKLCENKYDKLYAEASKIFCDNLIDLHIGQGLDIYWRDNVICPTEEEYKFMVVKKTGGLFGLPVKLMQLYSDDKKPDYLTLIDKLGLYFQIRDDYINLVSSQYHESKGFAEDLTEGKFSFVLIHAIKSNPNDQQLIDILRQKTNENDLKMYAIKLIEKFGSFEYTLNYLKDLRQQISDDLKKFATNNSFLAVLDILTIPELNNNI